MYKKKRSDAGSCLGLKFQVHDQSCARSLVPNEPTKQPSPFH